MAKRKRVRVETKTAPRNRELREVPFMGLDVSKVFQDTSNLDVHSKYSETARDRVKLAQERRARRRQKRVR